MNNRDGSLVALFVFAAAVGLLAWANLDFLLEWLARLLGGRVWF